VRAGIFFGGGSPLPKLLGAFAVPSFDLFVWDEGKGFGGEVDGERLAGVWVLDAEGADGVLDEGDVFFGAEKDLNRLPADEAFLCQGWDGRWGKIVGGGLEGVLAAD
jgi:hypothetical protein